MATERRRHSTKPSEHVIENMELLYIQKQGQKEYDVLRKLASQYERRPTEHLGKLLANAEKYLSVLQAHDQRQKTDPNWFPQVSNNHLKSSRERLAVMEDDILEKVGHYHKRSKQPVAEVQQPQPQVVAVNQAIQIDQPEPAKNRGFFQRMVDRIRGINEKVIPADIQISAPSNFKDVSPWLMQPEPTRAPEIKAVVPPSLDTKTSVSPAESPLVMNNAAGPPLVQPPPPKEPYIQPRPPAAPPPPKEPYIQPRPPANPPPPKEPYIQPRPPAAPPPPKEPYIQPRPPANPPPFAASGSQTESPLLVTARPENKAAPKVDENIERLKTLPGLDQPAELEKVKAVSAEERLEKRGYIEIDFATGLTTELPQTESNRVKASDYGTIPTFEYGSVPKGLLDDDGDVPEAKVMQADVIEFKRDTTAVVVQDKTATLNMSQAQSKMQQAYQDNQKSTLEEPEHSNQDTLRLS